MPNWCYNELEVQGTPDRVADFIEAIHNSDAEPGGDNYSILQNIVPMPEELVGTSAPGDTPNWYDWQSANWGVKWGDCYTRYIDTVPAIGSPPEDGYHIAQLTFDTPWGPAEAGLRKVSEAYPDLVFRLSYEEAGMGFFGRAVFRAGEITASMEGSMNQSFDTGDNPADEEWLYEGTMLRGG
jgi:hypothetical protein